MDQLGKHLTGLAKEAEKMLQSIPIMDEMSDELKAQINEAKKAFDFSGDLKQKQEQLNTLLNAITNNK